MNQHLHLFIQSVQEHLLQKLVNQVSDDVIKDRFDRLLAVVNEISKKRKLKKYQGTVQEVLIEEVNKKIPGYVTGRLSNNAVVHFEETRRYWSACKC